MLPAIAVFVFKRVHPVGPGDDELQFLDIDRFSEIVESAFGNCPDGAHPVGVTAGNNNFGMRRRFEDVLKGAQSFCGAIFIGWQAQVQNHDFKGALGPEQLHRFRPRAGNRDQIGRECPFHLTL